MTIVLISSGARHVGPYILEKAASEVLPKYLAKIPTEHLHTVSVHALLLSRRSHSLKTYMTLLAQDLHEQFL